jgi:hypothetical protein
MTERSQGFKSPSPRLSCSTLNNELYYSIVVSEFAFLRFLTNGFLTEEERNDKENIIMLTEEVLHAQGMECDATIAKVSEEQLKEILEKVRQLRKKKKAQEAESEKVLQQHYS